MSELYKYPRTPHLPISPGATSDDKFASTEAIRFLKSGIELIVTEKMDGGNLTFGPDFFHARSLSSGTHHWDTAAKALWSEIHNEIPEGWRISGESMCARRSVSYENLPGPYIVFGIWDENNNILDWDSMVEWCELFDLPHAPVIYRGNDFNKATAEWFKKYDSESSEGFVVRNAGSFAYEDFADNICKWVRKNHVRTSATWRNRTDYALNGFKK